MKVVVTTVPPVALPDDVAVNVVEGGRGVVVQVAADLSLTQACVALTKALQEQTRESWIYVGRARRGMIA